MTHSPTRDALAEALKPFADTLIDDEDANDALVLLGRNEGVKDIQVKDVRRARTALAEYEAEPKGWRTMDSAPKDGTKILAFNGAVMQFRWDSDSYAKKPRPFWMNYTLGKSLSRMRQPTHWQPLPLPPEPQK